MGTSKFNAGGNPAVDWHPSQGGGIEILLVASYYRNRDGHQPDKPLRSYMNSCRLYLYLNSCSLTQDITVSTK